MRGTRTISKIAKEPMPSRQVADKRELRMHIGTYSSIVAIRLDWLASHYNGQASPPFPFSPGVRSWGKFPSSSNCQHWEPFKKRYSNKYCSMLPYSCHHGGDIILIKWVEISRLSDQLGAIHKPTGSPMNAPYASPLLGNDPNRGERDHKRKRGPPLNWAAIG